MLTFRTERLWYGLGNTQGVRGDTLVWQYWQCHIAMSTWMSDIYICMPLYWLALAVYWLLYDPVRPQAISKIRLPKDFLQQTLSAMLQLTLPSQIISRLLQEKWNKSFSYTLLFLIARAAYRFRALLIPLFLQQAITQWKQSCTTW